MELLKDRVALITGASRGIGRAVALAFADAGAHVAFTYRSSKQAADELVGLIKKKGRISVAYQSDVASFDDARTIVEKVVAEFQRLDILVNNAGVAKDGLLLRMSERDWDEVIQTNLKGVFNFTKAACRQMISQRWGKIINITSVVGLVGNVGQANYAASKAGIIGFTKSIARELASRNILVNAVAPGYVSTDLTEKLSEDQKEAYTERILLKRAAKPEEIAAVVKFLASPDADYITGQVICVDGGMTM